MSEKILKALLQLFAIITRRDEDGEFDEQGRVILERFLHQQFTPDLVDYHLARFDTFVTEFHSSRSGSRARKRTSLNSVKVLKICTQVNEELTQRQKFVVLVHLLEFIHAADTVGDQDMEFVTTVAETFNIGHEEFKRCRSFVMAGDVDREDDEHLLYIDEGVENRMENAHHLHAHGVQGELRVLHVPSVNIYMMRYLGNGELLLNGQRVKGDHHYLLNNGASVRTRHGHTIYYSDILGCFLSADESERTVFRAEGIEYHFPNGRQGLHELNLEERSGKLIGIMGGSGSGKSTLLNVLNGNLIPSKGRVTINGVDVHREADKIRGVIGHVSQDDLLIEELTVFQNLYYNAKLCFGKLNDEQVRERVQHMLQALGLYETKDLKVGSALDKTISGGQRKRLNIALELIREPSVLFVDEPTSGLSSRDSENIMDLLKELSLKGRNVFVVIHQPSSDIFKMFDRLLLMDQEGHPVYYGDPVDAVVYFKRITGQVNSEVGQCAACGNVNPEQIFNILEARLVDEYGNETDQRRIGPEAWNEVFRAQVPPRVAQVSGGTVVPKSTFLAPGMLKQLEVYFKRDILSKLANRQYVLVNLLEAPVLAFVMAFFLRFIRSDQGLYGSYVFRENENIPQYLFISVIVALFLGLTVAAEEIIRDRKILQREKFLSLSRAGYILSKLGILFMISAIQTFLLVLVGNLVLGIEGMLFPYWMILFSTACFANVLGLNVSASFNSAKVIYIVIPVLIIPQLLFSGIIVKFDKLNPWFASESSVPWIGNIMASRWAYEGLAVTQFMDNEYERKFYRYDKRMRIANWKKDLWTRELANSVGELRRSLRDAGSEVDQEHELALLRNEIGKEVALLHGLEFPNMDKLTVSGLDTNVLNEVDELMKVLVKHYRKVYKEAEQEKEALIASMTATPELRKEYFELLDTYRNESLADFVTNKNEVHVITRERDALVQKSDPVYLDPMHAGPFGAHFYSPTKWYCGVALPTFWANVTVLWAMSLLFMVLLYMEAFPKLVAFRFPRRKRGY